MGVFNFMHILNNWDFTGCLVINHLEYNQPANIIIMAVRLMLSSVNS